MIDQYREKCSGCRACEQLCPQRCISMELDGEGFSYPQVDTAKCTSCGLCIKRCPVMADYPAEDTLDQPLAYACVAKNASILKRSSSGGMFSVLASHVLRGGGIVFGCALDAHLNACCAAVEKEEELETLRGSKYVQSDTRDSYASVKHCLGDGRTVLYVSTPCQIAGLKAYLGRPYKNLLVADLICHGVPSPWIFHQFISDLEVEAKAPVLDVQFREKSKYGWGAHIQYSCQRNGRLRKVNIPPDIDYYTHYYIGGGIYRKNCYTCKYASVPREGDFTMGDFWGVKEFHPEINAIHGVSFVGLNTQKGKQMFDHIGAAVLAVPSSYENGALNNKNLSNPSPRPAYRDTFYKDVANMGYLRAAQNQGKIAVPLKWRIKGMVPQWIKVLFKKLWYK